MSTVLVSLCLLLFVFLPDDSTVLFRNRREVGRMSFVSFSGTSRFLLVRLFRSRHARATSLVVGNIPVMSFTRRGEAAVLRVRCSACSPRSCFAGRRPAQAGAGSSRTSAVCSEGNWGSRTACGPLPCPRDARPRSGGIRAAAVLRHAGENHGLAIRRNFWMADLKFAKEASNRRSGTANVIQFTSNAGMVVHAVRPHRASN
ncbi:hypothetical protein Btru_069782 [Bulinus truncatus]|nr:hypothetical protein Btru_069782 [Bulinus truncatus]